MKKYWIENADFEDLPTDLQEEVAQLTEQNQTLDTYTILLREVDEDTGEETPYPEAAAAVFISPENCLGIAWGADATWATVPSLNEDIEIWLNKPDLWKN